jgi:hypothetical protein
MDMHKLVGFVQVGTKATNATSRLHLGLQAGVRHNGESGHGANAWLVWTRGLCRRRFTILCWLLVGN